MKLPIHGYYWVLPLVTFAFWITDIVGLLGLWKSDGFSHYERSNPSVVFISDVGARHRTFFIIFSSLSAVSYVLTTLAERHLRHQRRIPGSLRKRQTNLDIASVIFCFIGAAALILLSIFDDVQYPDVHWSMTVVFIVGVALSVLMQVLQIFSLSKSHDDELYHLRIVAWLKSTILIAAVIVVIIFVATYATCHGQAFPGNQRCQVVVSIAGVCEWVLAFFLSFFFLTYIVDFLPAKHRAEKGLTEKGDMVQDPALAEAAGEGHRETAPYAAARDMGPNHAPQEYPQQTYGSSYTNAPPSLNQPPMGESQYNAGYRA